MKNALKHFGISLLPILFLLALAPVSGCKSTEDTAYKVTGVTVVTAQAAYAAYLDWALATTAPAEQQAMVRGVYDKYYQSTQVEKAAVLSYKTGTDTNAIATAMAAVTASSADVVSLILQFLPPNKAAQLKGIQ